MFITVCQSIRTLLGLTFLLDNSIVLNQTVSYCLNFMELLSQRGSSKKSLIQTPSILTCIYQVMTSYVFCKSFHDPFSSKEATWTHTILHTNAELCLLMLKSRKRKIKNWKVEELCFQQIYIFNTKYKETLFLEV